MLLAGANSVFVGDKLLTTANNEMSDDHALLETLGLSTQEAKPQAIESV